MLDKDRRGQLRTKGKLGRIFDVTYELIRQEEKKNEREPDEAVKQSDKK